MCAAADDAVGSRVNRGVMDQRAVTPLWGLHFAQLEAEAEILAFSRDS